MSDTLALLNLRKYLHILNAAKRALATENEAERSKCRAGRGKVEEEEEDEVKGFRRHFPGGVNVVAFLLNCTHC